MLPRCDMAPNWSLRWIIKGPFSERYSIFSDCMAAGDRFGGRGAQSTRVRLVQKLHNYDNLKHFRERVGASDRRTST
jgi:hypothetical protein